MLFNQSEHEKWNGRQKQGNELKKDLNWVLWFSLLSHHQCNERFLTSSVFFFFFFNMEDNGLPFISLKCFILLVTHLFGASFFSLYTENKSRRSNFFISAIDHELFEQGEEHLHPRTRAILTFTTVSIHLQQNGLKAILKAFIFIHQTSFIKFDTTLLVLLNDFTRFLYPLFLVMKWHRGKYVCYIWLKTKQNTLYCVKNCIFYFIFFALPETFYCL